MPRHAHPHAHTAISRADKVLYPATGFTKGDVADYYELISPAMLPHLAGRPVTLKRHPDGVAQPGFYEKRCPANHPPYVQTATITSTTRGELTCCVVANLETLIWLADRAALEFHTYLYRAGAEQAPTMMVFDLDPGPPATLRDCLAVAVRLRSLLARLSLRSFAKTSGGKGLHMLVPLQGATFTMTKMCARVLAQQLAEEQPQQVIASMARDQRPGRVFIDWSQNDHGKTTVCAYSLRAGPHPTASVPVSWAEIEHALAHPAQPLWSWSPAEVIARVEEHGDLLAPLLSLRQQLPAQPPS